jgi:hypothetical protein
MVTGYFPCPMVLITLQAGYYRDAEFDDGKLYVIATVKTFSNVSFEDMGKKIIDKL